MTENTNDFKHEFSHPTKEHQTRERIQTRNLEFVGKSRNCCVCLVDIVDSTKLTANIPDSKASVFHSTFLNTMADVIEKHGGVIVKSIGDAVLFYFEDTLENYLGAALRCGLKMIDMREKINKKLNENNLPSINYRISSDFGKAMIGYSSVSVVDDIFGSVVNMCSKINRVANSNGMVIGNDFYIMAKILHGFQFKEIKHKLDMGLKNKYPVFDVKNN